MIGIRDPSARRFAVRTLAVPVALALLAGACSGDGDDQGVDSPTAATSTTTPSDTGAGEAGNDDGSVASNPGTAVPRPARPLGATISVETVVALLDACVTDDDLYGPCHCAATRLQANFSETDIEVFEDRFRGQNQFTPEVAAALNDCQRDEPPAAWSAASRSAFVAGCTKGSDRLADACVCAVDRGQRIVPESRIADFVASDDVVPGYVELINDCL